MVNTKEQPKSTRPVFTSATKSAYGKSSSGTSDNTTGNGPTAGTNVKSKKITTMAMAFMTAAAIISLRGLPMMAAE